MEKNAAYCLAKFAAAHRSSFCCNKYLLPAAVVDACRKDTSYFYLFLIILYFFTKKKKKNTMEKDGDLQKFIRLPNSSKLPLSHGFLTIRVIINAINSETNFPNAALDFQFD